MRIRLLTFFLLLTGSTALIFIFIAERKQPVFPRTLSPFLQQLGKPIQSANRTMTKMMPVSDMDEKMLGEEFRARYEHHFPINEANEKQRKYLNDLVRDLTDKSSKDFEYTVFLVPGPPNAFALPGGVICITACLFDFLSSEAELAGILGHEIGHIERGHLFDLFRKEMLQRKMNKFPDEGLTIDVIQALTQPLFSKSQEDEADEYGFSLLIEKGYDPFAMAEAFKKFLELNSESPNLIHDFFSTHPYMALRESKFQSRAESWQTHHSGNRVYIGKINLKEHRTRRELSCEEEYKCL